MIQPVRMSVGRGWPTGSNPARTADFRRVQGGSRFGSTQQVLQALQLDKEGYQHRHEILSRSMKPDNYLGEGHYNVVYRIPSRTVQYALRCPKVPDKRKMGALLQKVSPLTGLSNVSQPVAIMGNYEIHTLQPGVACGVPFAEIYRDTDTGRTLYLNYLQGAANLSQAAYDQLARTILALNERKQSFDYCQARNLLMDKASQSFHIVDLQPGSHHPLDLAHMVAPLLDTLHSHYLPKAQPPEVIAARRTILEKCLQAAVNTGLPLPATNSAPYEDLYQHPRIENVFERCGLAGKWPEYRAARIRKLPALLYA